MKTQFVLLGDLMIDITAVTSSPINYASDTRAHISEIADAPKDTCIVIFDATGERTMLPAPGATREVGQVALARACAGNLTCSLDTASAAPISANPGAIREALGQIDVLLANTDEAAALTGFTDPAQALVALAEVVDTVVIKCGPQGALAAQGNQRAKVPASWSAGGRERP